MRKLFGFIRNIFAGNNAVEEQARQEQVDYIKATVHWAMDDTLDLAEYLDVPFTEEEIDMLRYEGIKLIDSMIADDEYRDYSNRELRDVIELSMMNIIRDIRQPEEA